ASTDVQAEWFLDEYRDLLAIEDPSTELQLIRRSEDGQHFFYRQLHKGIPVFPGELAVHMDGGYVRGLNGGYVPHITVSHIPTLSAAQAEERALALSEAGSRITGDTQLRYVDLGLLGIEGGATYLTWQVHVAQG